MAPLKGLTLGRRQKYYNQLVEEAIASKAGESTKINFEDDDVDNMIRIDIACRERNVDYILEVFKCDDMLYVSRAINKSTWLITDPQYAHIMNPKYLHSKLFPQMNAKAVTKLMLHIRRHLKDEVRVKAFYKYINERDTKNAMKWLGNCSLEFIETIVAARAGEIPIKLLTRLCRKSINILRVYVYACKCKYNNVDEVYYHTKYFLKSYKTAEEFLDIMESYHTGFGLFINLNENYTNKLMKICPDRIKQNFQKFYSHIDLKTFAKHIKIDEIRSFLMANSSFSSLKTFTTLTPFLVKLPREDMLDFLSTLYGIECVNSVGSEDKAKSDFEVLFHGIESKESNDLNNFYRWYRFAPFDVAFRDIKKLISAEQSSEERHSMLIVLLTCAGDDFDHVKTVLQYYHEKHINEPCIHKKTFVISLLEQHDTFRFDDNTWKTLNALFHSLGVYIDSDTEVEACLDAIIVHSVIRDLPVHEVVEEKFEIKSLKDIKKKLDLQEQDKLFNYLYTLSVTKLCKQSTSSETGMHKAIKLLKSIWNLLEEWNRAETHHQFVIDKIGEFGEINNASSWIQEIEKVRRKRSKKKPNRHRRRIYFRPKPEPYVNIPSIYKMVNSYRIKLFENSLVLRASEEVLLNALKHDPGLLARHTIETNQLRCNDEVSLNRFLSKLRIYWSDSLAVEWTETNMNYLEKCTRHRALVRGILTLLPHSKILDFIKMYAPNENKIHWSEVNETELSIQQHIAKNMHIVRPQLPAEVALWYAKGDYLQYALLSVNSMYYNLRSSDIGKYIKLMLSAPVSLQKHGIRLAFAKYKTIEIIDITTEIWKKTRNSSIRMIIFKLMFNLLCKETKLMSIKAIWSVLSSFADDLNETENNIILSTLVKVSDVPLSVVGDCLQKTYLFLKTLPPHSKLDYIMYCILNDANTFIEYLDSHFVEKTILSSPYDIIENYNSSSAKLEILSAYLLCSNNSEIQMQKYNNLLHPVIEQCIPKWEDGKNDLLVGFQHLLENICSKLPHYVFEKNMTVPIEILVNIQNVFLKCSLCIKEHYKFIRSWQLTVRYLEILVDMIKASDGPYNWQTIRTASTEDVASICLDLIAADNDQFFSSVYLLFKDALQIFFHHFGIEQNDLLLVLNYMLDCNNPETYLLVLELIPGYGWGDDFVYKKEVIKRKIYFHPSEEVTMHYFRHFTDKYNKCHDVNDYSEDEDTEESECITDSETEEGELENVSHYEREVTKDATPKNNPTLFGKLCHII